MPLTGVRPREWPIRGRAGVNGLFAAEQDIPAPVHLLPGSYWTHLFAEFGRQIPAHHVWSRRSISLKHLCLRLCPLNLLH